MDDKRKFNFSAEQPKRDWVIQKLPIKGGNVLRSAMLHEDYQRTPDWVQVEGVERA